MELITKKTTILLSKRLHRRLQRLSKITNKSMGRLLRDAAERQYFAVPPDERAAAVKKMAAMQIPVGSPAEIKAEILRGLLKD